MGSHKMNIKEKRKELAKKLCSLKNEMRGFDEELYTEKEMEDALKTHRGSAYLLETFLEYADGSQEDEVTEKFYKASMDIVHYMQDLK